MKVVFLHGAGRAGSAAWPLQVDWDNAVFLTRPGYGQDEEPQPTDFETETRMVLDATRGGAHLVASSFGGVAAILAVGAEGSEVKSLVLCEPAAFALSRGRPAVEAHIAAMSPAFAMSETMSPEDFIVAFYSGLGIPDPQPPTTPEEVLRARRTQLLRAPWDVELDPSVFRRVPTLVVTGDWNPEYEETAEALVALGARHVHVTGHKHNPQEAIEFEGVVREFWSNL